MGIGATIADDLARTAPGPWLCAALDPIEVTRLAAEDTVTVLRAQYRQVTRERARFLASVVEVGLRRAPSLADPMARMAFPDKFSADEVRIALGLTRQAAVHLFDHAWGIVVRLPELHAAMLRGDLDEPRARTLAEWTVGLSGEHAGEVCAELLPLCRPDADGEVPLTTAQLKERATRLAIALDPDWAERRFQESLKRRRVVGRPNRDGTADLSGIDLPPERVAAACARLNNLARAAKRAGDPRPIDHLRADLFLGMTDGTYEGLTDAEILTALAATASTSTGLTPFPASTTAPTPGDGGGPQPGDASGASCRPARRDEGATRESELASGSMRARGTPGAGPAPSRRGSRAGVELRARISTLLGLDSFPAELASLGPIPAAYARELLEDLGAAQWRYVITDEHGYHLRSGLSTARPRGTAGREATCQATVDLLIPAALLAALTTDPPATPDPALLARWEPVLADLAARAAEPDQDPGDQDPGDQDPENRDGEDPYRRFPGAALRRRIGAAIPRCTFPGCRAPASRSELDHRRQHSRGGRTDEENLDPRCAHDHDIKDEAGWTVRRLDPERGYAWTTRLGHTYRTTMTPIIEALPPPSPRPRVEIDPEPGWAGPDPDWAADNRPWRTSTCWDTGPPPPEPQPPPPPDPDEIPPF